MNLALKIPFLPLTPIGSLYTLFGISHYKRTQKYVKPKTNDKKILSIIKMAWDGHFKVSPGTAPQELEGLLECVKTTKNLKGDIIELGTYKGGTSIHIAKYLDITNDTRTIFLCDTFEGFPYGDDHSKTSFAKKGYLNDTSEETVSELFKKNNLGPNIEIVKGKFEDTLFQKLDSKKFSLAFIDCDLFQSAQMALDFISKHIEDDGIICVHDLNDLWGAKKALSEFFDKKSIKFSAKNVIANMGILTKDT